MKVNKEISIYFGEVMGKPRMLVVRNDKSRMIDFFNEKELRKAFDKGVELSNTVNALLEAGLEEQFVEYAKEEFGVKITGDTLIDYQCVHSKDKVSYADKDKKHLLIISGPNPMLPKKYQKLNDSCVLMNAKQVFKGVNRDDC